MFTKVVFFQLCRYCTVALLGLELHLGLITLFVEVAGLHYSLATKSRKRGARTAYANQVAKGQDPAERLRRIKQIGEE